MEIRFQFSGMYVVGKMIDTTMLALEMKNAIFGDRKWLFFYAKHPIFYYICDGERSYGKIVHESNRVSVWRW